MNRHRQHLPTAGLPITGLRQDAMGTAVKGYSFGRQTGMGANQPGGRTQEVD
jgi:hypothetical protein